MSSYHCFLLTLRHHLSVQGRGKGELVLPASSLGLQNTRAPNVFSSRLLFFLMTGVKFLNHSWLKCLETVCTVMMKRIVESFQMCIQVYHMPATSLSASFPRGRVEAFVSVGVCETLTALVPGSGMEGCGWRSYGG